MQIKFSDISDVQYKLYLFVYANQNVQTKLISWIRNAEKIPEKVFCVHGEPESATSLAHKLRDQIGAKAFVPEGGESFEL